jgi:hypothetical protein
MNGCDLRATDFFHKGLVSLTADNVNGIATSEIYGILKSKLKVGMTPSFDDKDSFR